jgi:DNA-binding NarL/FixJ family response regulator
LALAVESDDNGGADSRPDSTVVHDAYAVRRLRSLPVVGRTVLIVDDHETFRVAARELLVAAGFAVVGEAGDGPGALAEASRLAPDIVLLDVQLPGLDGFAVADRLAEREPSPAVVLISSRDAITYGDRVRRASVVGFVAKRELSGAALARLVG